MAVLSELNTMITFKEQNTSQAENCSYLTLLWLLLRCNWTTLSLSYLLGNLRETWFCQCLHLHSSRNAEVTLVLELEAGLTACGANGCWFLSLAACSCSFAKRCFSSRVRDICRGWEGWERQGQWHGEPLVQHCVSQKGEGLWKRGVKLSSYSIRLCCSSCGSTLLPVDGTAAKYILDLKAGKSTDTQSGNNKIIIVFIRKWNVEVKRLTSHLAGRWAFDLLSWVGDVYTPI